MNETFEDEVITIDNTIDEKENIENEVEVKEIEEEKEKKSEDYNTIKKSVQQIRELAEKYEENAKEAEEAGSYCTTEDLSFAGVGMEDRIENISVNYKDMAQKLNDYADSLEASLNDIK